MNIVARHGRAWQRACRQSWRALILLLTVVPMLLPQSAAPVSAAPISYTESVDLDTKFTTTFTLDVGDNKFSGSLEPTPFPGGRDAWKMVIPANHRISRVRYSRGYLGSATSMTFVFDACWYSTPETTSSSFNQPLTVDGPRDVCILIFSNHNPSVIDWEVTVTVEEIPPNNPPVITVPGPLMTESGVPITFSSSDQISISEPDGDNLEVQLQVTGGTITLSSTSGLDFYRGDGVADQRMQFAGLATAINAALNGAVFTPADGFSGWASILIRVTDDYWLTAISDTISITVFPPSGQPTDNNPPIATNDTYTTSEDTPLTIAAPGVLGNDTDADGDTLTAGLVRGPANGTLTFNADGSFTYTPKANWNGTDSFTYLTYDGTAFSNVATVTITVNAVNDPPVASDDAYTTDEDTLLTITAPGVLSNDADVDGNPLTAVLEIGPANGTLTLNPDGSFTYTPNANWNGTDTFTYLASDGTTTSNIATVTITVNAVNDAPIAANDAYTTDEDTPLTIAAPGVLGNDTDIDGNPLTAVLENGPTNGTLTLNADGSFSYTPKANWHGTDTFTYHASDGTTTSNVATVTITVNSVNDVPVAMNESYTTDEDTPLTIAAPGVLGNDTDVENDPLTAVLESGLANGTLTLNPDGSFIYTPNANWNGTDTFTYRASDGTDSSNVATVTITVNAVNDAPVAANDAYTTDEDTPLTIAAPGVLGNDSDADGNTLTAALENGPTNGMLTLNANGSFTYTPNADWNGTDTFTYLASDGAAASNVATVTITVGAVNDVPVAADDAYTTDEDTPLTIAAPGVLGNDSNADGDTLTAVLESGPANGALVLNADGSFTYTPNADWNGTDSFTYHASDENADSNIATVTITVGAVNDVPVAVDDAYTTDEDKPLRVPAPGVLGNDSDVEGDALTAALDSGPSRGTVTLNPDGSFEYIPAPGFFGTDTFTYALNDGGAVNSVATVTITVGLVNGNTYARDDWDEVSMNGSTLLDVLANDTDPDGDPLHIAQVSQPRYGVATIQGNRIAYTPHPGFVGTDTFTYIAADDFGSQHRATVNVTVWKPVPLCADFDGSTSEVVRATVPDDVVTGGSVFCRILVEHGEFVRPSAEVGRPEVLNLGVLQAVDVFALRHDGTATASFTTGMTVCLQGQGTLLYLDATVAPRAIVPLSAFSRDGYTCASVPNAGTVALVSGTANVTSTVTNSPAPVGASAPLANCMVTTRNILNLRAEPSSAGAVIRTIPYNVTLTAFERAGAWFYVDYLGERGWLSADYVTPRASCGE